MPLRRSPQRLLAIVDAATEVFAQKGFAAAQLVDVARMAGVSVATLYNYVEGKGALLLLLLCVERPFADITAGHELPVPTPDRTELISRLDRALTTHVRVAALDAALASKTQTSSLDAQFGETVGQLFDLIAIARVAADAMERSAREAPDLARSGGSDRARDRRARGAAGGEMRHWLVVVLAVVLGAARSSATTPRRARPVRSHARQAEYTPGGIGWAGYGPRYACLQGCRCC